jgi:hypothetical protein
VVDQLPAAVLLEPAKDPVAARWRRLFATTSRSRIEERLAVDEAFAEGPRRSIPGKRRNGSGWREAA